MVFFEPPSTTLVGDIHMRSQSFLFEIQFGTTFIWTFFDAMHIFGSVDHQSESTFPFFYIIIFQKWISFEPLAPLCGEIDICARRLFCTKLNYKQLLLETFLMRCVFLAAFVRECKNSFIFINNNVNSSANDWRTIFYDKLS